jgi:DNA-binding response OmpR family regulator
MPMISDAACVLIVENDASARAYLRTLLRREGISVEAVGDAEGAFKVLAVRTYRLVLLDVYLGAVTGFEVLDFMVKSGIRTPVIITSAAEEEVLGRAQHSPVVKLVMQKPLDTDQLTAIVRKFCDA